MAIAFAAWLLSIFSNWTADGLASLKGDVAAWARLNDCAYRALRAAVRQEFPDASDDEIEHTGRALADILWGQQSPLVVSDGVDASYLERFGRAVAERFAVLDDIRVDGTNLTQAQAMHLNTARVSDNFLTYFIWALEDAAVRSDAIRTLWQVLAEGRAERCHSLTHRYLQDLGRASSEILKHLEVRAAPSLRAPALTSPHEPGAIYFAQPVPAFRVRFGREREIDELSAWLHSGDPLYLLYGPGGIGKTTLVLDWLGGASVQESGLEGVFYWAFDHENSLQDFMDWLSGHLGDDPSAGKTGRREWVDQPLALARVLSSHRILLVLDGFERQLAAYDFLQERPSQHPRESADIDILRRITTPDTARFLRYLCAPANRSKTLVLSRLVPYELLGDLGQVEGCVISRLAGLSADAADQLLGSFAPQLGNAERGDIAKWADCHPQLLRLIGSMIVRGRISAADISCEQNAQAAIVTHAEGPRGAVDDLVRGLPSAQQAALACACAIGRWLSPADIGLAQQVIGELAAGVFSEASCLQGIREALALVAPPDLYTYDSGGPQGNPSEGKSSAAEPSARISRFGSRSAGDAVAQFAQLAELGLIDRAGDGYSIHPVVQAVALKFLRRPALTHLIIAYHFAARQQAIERTRGDHDLGLLVRIYTHLVEAGQLDAAADLLFLRIIRPLFFGSTRFHDLRTYTRALLGQPTAGTLITDPGKRAHVQGFFARILSKTGDSLAAVEAWKQHISLRRGMGDMLNVAAGLGYLSQDQVLLGDLAGAVRSLHEAIGLTREVLRTPGGRDDGLAITQLAMHLTFLGSTLTRAGQLSAAQHANQEARQLWQQVDQAHVGRANCALNDGEIAALQQQLPAVDRAAHEAQENSELAGYERGRILGLRLQALAAIMAGRPIEGQQLLEDALEGCRSTRFTEVEPDLLLQLSWTAIRREDYPRAHALADEVLELASRLGYRLNVADACLVKAHLLTDSSPREAMSWCEEALAASFSPDWRDYIIESQWAPTWWDACRSGRAGDDAGIVNEEWWWKCGYKAAMDSALTRWTTLLARS